jgi:hypothetical protein
LNGKASQSMRRFSKRSVRWRDEDRSKRLQRGRMKAI